MAVTGTMIVTSVIFFEVARTRWRWPLGKAVPLLILFMCFDVPFFGASLFKFTDGGFVPVLIGALLFAIMFTWKRGWTLYRERITRSAPPLDRFILDGAASGVLRTPGVGIFVSGGIDGTPPVLSAFVGRIRALPECVVILTMTTSRSPHAMEIKLESLTAGLYRMSICTGFMDRPNVRAALAVAIERYTLPIDLAGVTYYLGHHTFLATSSGRMGRRSEWLFALLARNARPATEHFGIPSHQVVELGSLIDL